MPPLIEEVAYASPAWRDLVALRQRVLRTPLGLAYSDTQLAAEADQLPLALRLDQAIVGVVLLVIPDANGVGRLRQMAIDPAWAGRGLGRLLFCHAERLLRRQGARMLSLSARASAVGFYEKLGLQAEGDPYEEVTIPHQRMHKSLSDAALAIPPEPSRH